MVLDARGLDDRTMQAIARETNLSETAFVSPSDVADIGVRYFTPSCELPLAGHPTIATTHALCEAGRFGVDRSEVTIHMPAGVIPVAIERGEPTTYAMSQPPPQFLSTFKRGAMAKAIGLEKDDLLAGLQPQTVSTGTPQLHIALASLDALDRVRVDRDRLFPGTFPETREYSSVHIFARADDGHALHSRHFCEFGDVLEDPFTGSATGGMAAYCARYGIVTEQHYRVAQGMHVKRPGAADVTVTGAPPDAIGRIIVAGPAVTVLRGTLTL